MKSTVEAMSGIYAQLIGHDVGILPLVEACNKILDYVLENGFGGGSSNPLTPAQIEKIKKDVIDRIKTQVPIGVMLKDCELIGSKLKYTLSDDSNKELDLATLINKSVKDYVDTHKSEFKGEQGVAGVNGKSAYELWKEKGNIGTEQDFLNSLKGAKGDIGQQGQKGEKGNTGESAFETWKRIKSKPTANETEFLDSLKGAKGDTGNNGAAGVQGQKGNDGIGITNIEKVGDKLKITLSNGQIKEFTLPSGGSGTTGITEEQVKTLINTLYKPQIDSKLERGSLDKSITADQLKKSIDKNTNKLTQTITDLELVGDKLRYKENGIEKSIILPSGSGGLTTQQVKQIIDTDYVPMINSKLEKGYYTGKAEDLAKSIDNKVDKTELDNYTKKSDISEFIKKTDADDKYNTKKEFDKLKYVATTELSLSGNDLKFKENGIEKTINLPISNSGGLTETQVKSIIDRDYKPSIDSKAEKSELVNYAKKSEITNFITETKADSKYQTKGNYATQTELNNKLDKVTYQQDIATLNNSIDSKQDKATALKIEEVKAEIQKIVGTAPEALNTLQELAEALGNDPNKINTIITQLGLKADKTDLNTLKEKTITEVIFENNKIKYKENGLSKEIDLSSYVNPSTQDIETIVENKGNTLYEGKDNTIVKNLIYDTSSKKITYKMNNESKEIDLPNLQGKDGISLDFNWDGTKLGIKKSSETSYTYVDLKGSQGTQGLKGVGIKEISLLGNNLNIKLDTDEVKTITLPLLKGEQGNEGAKGKDGIGITNITSSGTELTVSLTDGSNKKFNIPTIKGDKGENGLNGAKGLDGVGIKNITQQGKKINVELTNNTNKEFNIPEQELPNGNTILNKIVDEGQQNDFTKLKGKLDIKEPDLSSYLKTEDFNAKFLEEFEKNCVVLTKSEYEALLQKDPHKFYLIKKG